MQTNYNPKRWFWIVAADESRAWSSEAASYVSEYPLDRVTRIANEVELYDVVSKRDLASRAPSRVSSLAEIRAALVNIDAAVTGDASDAGALTEVAANLGVNLPAMA